MIVVLFFLFKQKTAYEMRISDWSSDVCSSDLLVDFKLEQFQLLPFRVDAVGAWRAIGQEFPLIGGHVYQHGPRRNADHGRPFLHILGDRKSTSLNSSH